MYVIVAYDVAVERLDKVRGLLRQYLNWVQNSAFEGELTAGRLEELTAALKDIIEESVDSVIFYTISNPSWLKKRVVWREKSAVSPIV